MADANKGMNPLHVHLGAVRKSGFESRITFGRGNQSARGQMHLALAEVCNVRVLSVDIPGNS